MSPGAAGEGAARRLLPISPGEGLDARGLLVAAEALAEAGAHQLVLREPWLEGEGLAALAESIVDRLPGLILHIRCPGALAVARAHRLPVHLRDGDSPPEGLRWGQSCHSLAGAQAAVAAGASYVTLSPAYSPGSKPEDQRPTLGAVALGRAQAALDAPIFALGGVGPDEARALRAEGVYGAAVIHTIFGGSPTPESLKLRCRTLLDALAYSPTERFCGARLD